MKGKSVASSKALPADALLLPDDIKDVLTAAARVAVVPSRRSILEQETVKIPADLLAELIIALEDSFPGIVMERQRSGR